MADFFDWRWFLLVPAALAVGFLAWVFVCFTRDRTRHRKRYAQLTAPRSNQTFWE
jgi:predicted MFS family arabinose efflux permease